LDNTVETVFTYRSYSLQDTELLAGAIASAISCNNCPFSVTATPSTAVDVSSAKSRLRGPIF